MGERPSGRFLLRVPPALHARLRRAAKEAGVSLNDHCTRALALPQGAAGAPPALASTAVRAAELFGPDLIAVAAFGSWCRGDIVDPSDLDLVVVVDSRLRLGRRLYRRWDESPIAWNGHRLEPQFLHLPEPGGPVAGVWAEIAMDGFVLLDRSFELSRRLGGIRRDMAEGRLVRRTAHGQPYWTSGQMA